MALISSDVASYRGGILLKNTSEFYFESMRFDRVIQKYVESKNTSDILL